MSSSRILLPLFVLWCAASRALAQDAGSQLTHPDQRADLVQEIRAQRARELDLRVRAAAQDRSVWHHGGAWLEREDPRGYRLTLATHENYSLAPHLVGSVTLILGGVGLGVGSFLAAITSPARALVCVFSSTSCSSDEGPAVALATAGALALTTGLIWLIAAVGGHRSAVPDQLRVSAGASSDGAWLGLGGSF